MTAEALRLYGTAEPVAPVQQLRAGPLSLELQRGRLKRIRCGTQEVWHGLAFVLRDADWGTPEPELQSPVLQVCDDAFDLRLAGRYAAGISFQLHISGRADGSLRMEVQAQALADVAVNRLGLCLMHPLAACGARVEVGHVDGRSSATTFPTTIPPWPPFMLVRALRHEWAPGRWAEAELQGDSFETEDQRNNGDASFKTYSRSNLAPRPYTLAAGSELRQSALLRVEPGPVSDDPPAPCTLEVGAPAGPLPPVGIEIHATDALEPALLAALRDLQPAHLHLAWRPGLAVAWPGVAAMLAAAGAGLRLDLDLGPGPGLADADDAALQALAQALGDAGITPEAIAVFPSTRQRLRAARRAFPGVAVGGGTPHFFVQLRRLDELVEVDFASFTTASLVHGADDDEVMLGLASLPAMVDSWRASRPELPLRVGPSAIAARSSPLGAQPASDGQRRLALAAVDPRSRAQFGAAWALGHVAALATAGVQAITLYALSGPNGLVSVEGGRLRRHPAFEVLKALGRPAQRLACRVSRPEQLAALVLMRDGRVHRLLANLTPQPLLVQAAAEMTLEPYAVSLHG